MQGLKILIHESPNKAVNWNRDHVDVRSAELTEAHIVLKGTEAGNSTVDLVLTDQQGNQLVAMTTGVLLTQLAAAIQGAESR